jgi:hypothetical protein
VIAIIEGFTRIAVAPDQVRQFTGNGYPSTAPPPRSAERRSSTGAPVTALKVA